MSTGRGGRDRERDRYHRDHHPRSEERSHHGRENPPSRHLWVGNLSHSLSESTLANHFLRFGELESVAFQPGRSYAFINFKDEEGAFAAARELKGYVVAGNPLRIEFAKAEKSSPSRLPRDEEYFPRRDERPMSRRSPFPPQRDLRTRHSTPDLPPPFPDKSRSNDKGGDREPSEVLWIGFPAQLKVDEFILRKAFSPFGQIDKITAFPGRTYAFVRYKNVMAASRAKETLQGKLFGNPRVHICFARAESGNPNKERSSLNDSPSSHMRPCVPDRSMSAQSMGPVDSRLFGRKDSSWTGEDDRRRFPGSELGPADDAYRQRSPPRKRVFDMRQLSPPPRFPRQEPLYDDSWDLPEDPLVFHEAKKLRTGSYHPENELPEYPFTDMEPAKHRGYPEFPQAELMNSTLPYQPENDRWDPRFDSFNKVGSGQLGPNAELKRLTPEPHPPPMKPPMKNEWKWEGTIAKGGTTVCRARCFPVGKPLDMILPTYLDCTARTSLDMLAKHYYQAVGSWVVFFVPASDPDISFYNEFMNYLGEKQRAAVAKLDDRTTMFLVPPSDFSEKILKVPGKLSISGVVLRLEPSGPSYSSLHQQPEKNETGITTFPGMASFANPISPNTQRSGNSNMSFPRIDTVPSTASFPRPIPPPGNFAEPFSGDRNSYMANQQYPPVGQNWSSSGRNDPTIGQGYNPVMPSAGLENSNIYKPEVSSIHSSGNNKPPLQPEQLALLASSLLGQQRQPGVTSTGQDFRQPGPGYQPENVYRPPQQNFPVQNNNQGVDLPSSQFGQMQQMLSQQQATTSLPGPPPREHQQHGNTNLNQLQTDANDESDPQKRLQATLQLAAALLHQIQQGKGN